MEPNDLQAIASRHLEEQARTVERIVGKGFVNDIYVLTIGSSKSILRIDPTETTPACFEKEAWCMEAAEKAGVPVPKVLGSGMQAERPYLLISLIEGIQGKEADEEGRKLIWSRLGEYARRIHAIHVEGYGEDMTEPGVFNGSWSERVEYNISSLGSDDELLSQGIITREQSEMLKRTFLDLERTDFEFGLIHNDLSLKNSILGSDGKVYLLDWGSAGVDAVPHMDFAEVLQSSLTEESPEFALFREGYGVSKKEFGELKPEMHKLQLLGFTDKVRWAMDRKPELLQEKAEELRQAMVSS
jgi:aminoglycoside phosphotransferase (APT) family kinase protein